MVVVSVTQMAVHSASAGLSSPQKQQELWVMDAPPPSGADRRVSGWLCKQHQRDGRRWGKRWFVIDDRRGRFSYGHKEGSAKLSVSLPLQEITVAACEGGKDHCFVVCCSPIRLVLSASSEMEMRWWMKNLELRIDVWKSKALAEGPRVARLVDTDTRSDFTDGSYESTSSAQATGFRL